jgi:gliding motility-associated-like protein
MIRLRPANLSSVFLLLCLLLITISSSRVFAQINTGHNGELIKPDTTRNSLVLVDNTRVKVPSIAFPANASTPVATITVRNQPSCFGKPDTFTLNVTNITAYSEQWMVNGVPVPGPNTPVFATNVLYDGDKINCVVTPLTPGSQPITSNTIVLHVLPQVVPSISITPGGLSACQGTRFTFTANVVNGGINPTIQWYLNGQAINNPGLTYTASNFQTGDKLQCTLINNSDCTYSNTANSNIPTIIINDNTSLSLSIAPEGNSQLCPGSQITFQATLNAQGIDPSYQWYLNGQPVGTNSDTYTNNFNNGDVITCQLTNVGVFGCFTNTNAVSNLYTIQFSQQAAPTISIAQTTTGACAGSPATFTATAANDGASPQYQWQVNGVNAGDDQDTFTSDSLQNGDNITCILTDNAGGCSAPITSNTVIAGIDPLPVVTFAPSTVSINSGASTTLAPQITGDIATYSWTPTTGLSDPTIQDPVASPASTTQYTLQVTTTQGCQASGTVTVDVFTQIIIPNTFTPNGDGINDIWDIKGLEFFPGATVEVYNRYGSLVYRSVNYAIPWDGKFDGKLLPVSTYYYIIDPKNGKAKLSGSLTIIK